jgi:hypothetical protein
LHIHANTIEITTMSRMETFKLLVLEKDDQYLHVLEVGNREEIKFKLDMEKFITLIGHHKFVN